jgi:hypothetical protein
MFIYDLMLPWIVYAMRSSLVIIHVNVGFFQVILLFITF